MKNKCKKGPTNYLHVNAQLVIEQQHGYINFYFIVHILPVA